MGGRVIFDHLAARFILWGVRHSKHKMRVTGYEREETSFYRYCPFWIDEFTDHQGGKHFRPPWWRPFNILLHRWVRDDNKAMHDHPRWSITICLRGELVEHTPWGSRTLRPGSIVVRSHKAIHAFEVPPSRRGKTWTVFIVGQRNHRQNDYWIKGWEIEA